MELPLAGPLEVEHQLLGRLSPHPGEDLLVEVLDDLAGRRGQGDRDSEAGADRPRLPVQDLQDHDVDQVVLPVVGQDPDRRARLPEAVHPALPLLVAGRIPRQVVVEDGIEVLLEVDPLAEAVGADENPLLVLIEGEDAVLPLLRRQLARDRCDLDLGPQLGPKVLGKVLGCVDEPAEDDRVVAVRQDPLELGGEGLELGVLSGPEEGPHGFGQLAQTALGGRTLALSKKACRGKIGCLLGVAVIHVQDAPATDLVRLGLRLRLQVVGTLAHRGDRGRRTAGQGTEQRQCGPPTHPSLALVSGLVPHQAAGEVQDISQDFGIGRREAIGGLPFLRDRELGLAEEARDVAPATLHEVAGQLALEAVPALVVEGVGILLELAIEEPDQGAEGLFLAAVRRGGDQQQVPLRILREPLDQAIPLVPGLPHPCPQGAAVGLVDDDEIRTMLDEIVDPSVGLDEIDRDDHEAVALEHGLRSPPCALELVHRGRQDQVRLDVELVPEFPLPLLRQVGRTHHGQAIGLATLQELLGDQAGFDSLADADVIGDEEPGGLLPEGHHQRDELIGPGLAGDPPEGTEGPCCGPGRQPGCLEEQLAGSMAAQVLDLGRFETSRFHRLECGQDSRGLLVQTAQRSELEEIGRGVRQDHPLASADADEVSHAEGFLDRGFGHGFNPKTLGYSRTTELQSEVWWKRIHK